MLDSKANREALESKILKYYKMRWIQLGDKNKNKLHA